MPISSWKQLRYLAAFIVIWMGSIFSAEVVFRLLGDVPSEDLGNLYVPFSERSYKLRPWTRTGADWSSGEFDVYTDGLGLRCGANCLTEVEPGDELDALFLGDSQGFGNGVDFRESLAGSVAYRAYQKGYHFANASVPGHHPPNQLELAKWLYQSQQVKAENYVLLLTPLSLASCDNPAEAVVASDGRLYDEPDVDSIARLWLKTNSVIYSRLRDAIRNSGWDTKPEYESNFIFDLYGAGKSENEIKQSCIVFFERFLAFAAEHKARVHLVYVPFTLEMDFEPIQSAAVERSIPIDPNLPMRSLTAAAKQLDLPLLDLRPILRELHSRGSPLSLNPDAHYNEDLSKACGSKIWQFLIEEPSVNDNKRDKG